MLQAAVTVVQAHGWFTLNNHDQFFAAVVEVVDELCATRLEVPDRRTQRPAFSTDESKPDPKPAPLAQELDATIAEASAEHGALDRQREDILAEKIALVDRRRPALVREAEHAVEDARKHYLQAVDAVEAAREELVGLN